MFPNICIGSYMKRNYILLLLFIICFSIFSQDIDVTVYCDDSYPPYSYIEKNNVSGIYVDILKKASSRMDGYNIVIRGIPWKRGLQLLKSGKGFALFPPYFRPVDRPYMDYSVPILSEELVVLCREEILSVPRNIWVDDYIGLNVGINLGFKSISEENAKKINIQEFGDNRTNILKLGLGRIDCYVNDKVAMLWTLKNLKDSGEYDEGGKHSKLIVGATISKENGYLGYTNKNDMEFYFKEDFKTQLDQIINKMKESGEIAKIIDAYIK